jgi:hypothetical protein
MAGRVAPNIVKDGLIFYLDAANIKSYVSSSVVAYSLVPSGSFPLIVSCSISGGVEYNTSNLGSFTFNGTTGKLLIENTPVQSDGIRLGTGNAPWMVNVWLKTSVAGDGLLGTFPVLTNRSGGPVYSSMGIGPSGVLKYSHYSGSWLTESGSRSINNNQWHMATWVNKDNNTLDMYVDGIFDRTVSSSIVGQPNPVDIIASSWAGSYLNASIALVAIYKRSSLFNSTEVLQNYNALKGRFGL